MKIVVTLQEVGRNGDWGAFCTLKGLDPGDRGMSGAGGAEFELTMQEAIDVGLVPGKKTPEKTFQMQVDGAVLDRRGYDGEVYRPIVLPRQFVLFGVPWHDPYGGLCDAYGSWSTMEEALSAAEGYFLSSVKVSISFQIMDKRTGECWKVERKEVCASSEQEDDPDP